MFVCLVGCFQLVLFGLLIVLVWCLAWLGLVWFGLAWLGLVGGCRSLEVLQEGAEGSGGWTVCAARMDSFGASDGCIDSNRLPGVSIPGCCARRFFEVLGFQKAFLCNPW